MRKTSRRILLVPISVVVAASVAPLVGQSQTNPKPPTFQAASIKPNTSADSRGVFLQPGGRFRAIGIRMRELIRIAYGEHTFVLPAQIVGGPEWLASDRFDIVAKAESEFVPAMLRSLIEDRCKAKVHVETRELPIYNLVVIGNDKHLGPQLRRAAGDCIRPAAEPVPPASAPDPSRLCGSTFNNLNGVLSATAVSMQSWVEMLAGLPVVGRVVRDKTGLSGEFDVRMEFVPAFLQNPNPNGSTIPNPAADSGPNLFTALQEQLGVKLESSKGPVDVLVIDHIEKPTPD